MCNTTGFALQKDYSKKERWYIERTTDHMQGDLLETVGKQKSVKKGLNLVPWWDGEEPGQERCLPWSSTFQAFLWLRVSPLDEESVEPMQQTCRVPTHPFLDHSLDTCTPELTAQITLRLLSETANLFLRSILWRHIMPSVCIPLHLAEEKGQMFAGGMDETWHGSKGVYSMSPREKVGRTRGWDLALPTLPHPGMALQAIREF